MKMNRYLTFKNINVTIGKLYGNESIPNLIKERDTYNVDVIVNDKYVDLNNEFTINVDFTVSYGTIEKVIPAIRKRDLYYLNTAKETISKERILNNLMEQEFIKYIIVKNLRK